MSFLVSLLVPRSGPMSKANRRERRCHRKARQSLGSPLQDEDFTAGVVKEETFLKVLSALNPAGGCGILHFALGKREGRSLAMGLRYEPRTVTFPERKKSRELYFLGA